MDQRPSFSTDSMASIVLLLTKMHFLSQIRPKNSVSPLKLMAGKEPASDIRDWEAIQAWANSLIDKL
jgi:hypothetical protein